MRASTAPDPVHEDDGGWYFWHETWADREGPFPSEQEARFMFAAYCHFILGPN